MSTYAPPAVTFVRGEGSWLFDTDDKRYLDLLSGLAVTSLGHAHPELTATISAQAATLTHVSNLFGNEHNEPLARTIDHLLGGPAPESGEEPLGRVFFTNSGAEANECALKVARKYGGRGRHVVVSAYGSFHGRTLATLHATGQPHKHEAFQPLPEGFRHVAWNDLEALENSLDETVGAVLLETIQGEGGVNPAHHEFLLGARRLCDERGALLMIDEIQTGFGRCGAWFAHQLFDDVRPDVVTLAKALGNGVPIGACWARTEVADAFVPGDHGTTYGGQPLVAAVARQVLEIMAREDAPGRARSAGQRIRDGLSGRRGVVDVRGLGLLLAIELDGLDARPIAAALLERGVVVNAVTPTALRLAPSLLITDDEVKLAIAAIGGAIDEAALEASTAATS